ncbi:MAG: hypothetical protein GX878_08040 [Firmicutes bacterium]|nr:hypothetical protein [Bacillota bacterium]
MKTLILTAARKEAFVAAAISTYPPTPMGTGLATTWTSLPVMAILMVTGR